MRSFCLFVSIYIENYWIIHCTVGFEHSISIRSREEIVPLCVTTLSSVSSLCALELGAPQYKVLESVQSRATKVVEVPKGKTYKQWLRSPGWHSLKKGRLRGDLITVCNFLREGSGGEGTDLSLW